MAKTPNSILIVDDDPGILTASQMFLKQLFSSVQVESDPQNIPGLINEQMFDVILLDMNFTLGKNDGSEGIYWLNRILEQDPSSVVVFITAFGGMGSIRGSLYAAFILGMLEAFVGWYFGMIHIQIATLTLLLVVLAVRPQGLMGRE